ncbi:3-oxoacyl-ACP reductase FabG [Naumannella halotolerans]|uniref:3-oxoacyl-ACP reductase FabG n=1 Tax=Naumannella halotolerans TaxID=993414 RepID=UPI00370D128E
MSNEANEHSRVAIVTGGARGIGAAVAKRLAADGNAVAIFDLTTDAAADTVADIERDGGVAKAYGVDVSEEQQVVDAVAKVAEEVGAPVIVVNNAGLLRDNLIFKMSVADWDTVMAVHLRGAFLTTREAQKYMVENRFGRVINLSSTSALGNRGQVNYSAAKAGMQGFTKTLAIELGKFGVTANAIAPGLIETEMTKQTAERMRVPYEDFIAAAISQIPIARPGKPEDIAATASFLASDEAGFVSGQVIYVAGGPQD